MPIEHTPGPWTPGGRPETANVVFGVDPVDGHPQTVASVHGYSAPEVAANARLIAAAPALLAALEKVLDDVTYMTPAGTENCRFCDRNMDHLGTFEDMHSEDYIVHTIRAALAKARES